jgi:SAM-dependent methyltransferase
MTMDPAQLLYNKVHATLKKSKHRPKGMLVRQPMYIWNAMRATPYRMAGAPDGFPIPSSKLLIYVNGTPDIRWFLQTGYLAAESMVRALKDSGINIKNCKSILDFGCGCGRVIRHLNFLKNSQLHGTDYNPTLVNWCQENLPLAKFQTNQLSPPLAYEDSKFDLIYAFSVFTHLPEELQYSWRDEILRMLKPGGTLVMSTNGEYYFNDLSPKEQDLFREGKIVIRGGKVAGSNFCNTYYSTRYVRQTFGEGFSSLNFFPQGARGNPYQDLFVLKKT